MNFRANLYRLKRNCWSPFRASVDQDFSRRGDVDNAALLFLFVKLQTIETAVHELLVHKLLVQNGFDLLPRDFRIHSS